MSSRLPTVKVDAETFSRINDLSRLLSITQKDVVREVVELFWTQKAPTMHPRVAELNAQVAELPASHDGTTLSSLSMLTGRSGTDVRVGELAGRLASAQAMIDKLSRERDELRALVERHQHTIDMLHADMSPTAASVAARTPFEGCCEPLRRIGPCRCPSTAPKIAPETFLAVWLAGCRGRTGGVAKREERRPR